ncbi:unnamed protein product [Microthlaspi erraticum]|uniref:Uncharacterized protein n=1 Tax=Microthlaspi erraticum TaxID=1685480 RepID=A0A6D2HDL6_9BRAS|nr:unnamed protein product [Microthlaspi erraticum]
MALLSFGKKKNVAKRGAWKSFTNKLRSKFRDLEIAPSVRDSTSRLLRVISRRLIAPFQTRYLQNTIPRTHLNEYYSHSHSRHAQRQGCQFLKFFSRPFAKRKRLRRHSESNDWRICQYQSQRWRQGEIKREQKVLGREKEREEEEGTDEIVDSIEDAWRRVVATSPHLRVDERADEFIFKFKEERRMEK